MKPLFLEDLNAGDRHVSSTVAVTEADIIEFAKKYDPQPMHLDPAAAAAGPTQGLIASGWHTAAIVMGLIVDAKPLGGGPVLGLGVNEIRWPQPVRPGDTIQVETEVVSITPSKSKPNFGAVQFKITARNQRGEAVMTLGPILWVPRRPA